MTIAVDLGRKATKQKIIFERKIVNIFLPIGIKIYFGAQKNRLNETVLLSTHNICFG